jgi:hypothetical protein
MHHARTTWHARRPHCSPARCSPGDASVMPNRPRCGRLLRLTARRPIEATVVQVRRSRARPRPRALGMSDSPSQRCKNHGV